MEIEAVTVCDINSVGLRDVANAQTILARLAGSNVTDDIVEEILPLLLTALKDSPDPDRALANFDRWTNSVTNRYTHFQYLIGHPTALNIFLNVCGVSQYFSDILIRNPEYFEILANPGVRSAAKSGADIYRELSSYLMHIQRPELKLEAMRRFKLREVLRIGTRDILGLADMPTTAEEFSNLADACVQKCLELAVLKLRDKYLPGEDKEDGCRPQVPFVVIAMGKHGGQELNYSSDIDLMFVCGDQPIDGYNLPITPLEYAHKLAEDMVKMLTDKMQNGHLFRVDMRLRPEGRFGPLVRTLSSYKSYYESWAEPWERQALIKSRSCAGDSELAQDFTEIATAFVYRPIVTSSFIDAIRQNKERIEQKALIEKQTNSNVKVGFGGIRDIEFSAQILQLQYGGRNPQLRTANTLEAIGQLQRMALISPIAASDLSLDYIFLRTVEHRLQILKDAQTQSIPADSEEVRLLARRLGFSDEAAFWQTYKSVTERVNGHFKTIFYGTSREKGHPERDIWYDLLFTIQSESTQVAIIQALSAEGFNDPEAALHVIRRASVGTDYGEVTPETRTSLLKLAGKLISQSTRTNDPDQALNRVLQLAEENPNPAAFYNALFENEDMLARLTILAAGSSIAFQSLLRHPEWLDSVLNEVTLDPTIKTPDNYSDELKLRTKDIDSEPEIWNSIAGYIERERLKISAREVWQTINLEDVGTELSGLASGVLNCCLHWLRRITRDSNVVDNIAIIGLGKLGGSELGYGSDWDILAVYHRQDCTSDEEHSEQYELTTQAIEFILRAQNELRPRGAKIEIDVRLRPEGKKGALAYTVNAYRDYYMNSALTWEKQVLVKARFISGNPEIGNEYIEMVRSIIYLHPLSESNAVDIRNMKSKIEKDRLKPENRHSDLKLGFGGLSDIEFLVQLKQMQHGYVFPSLRETNTIDMLNVLGGLALLPAPDAARIANTYKILSSIRNRLALQGATNGDVLPTDTLRLRSLALSMGYVDRTGDRAEIGFARHIQAMLAESRSYFERWFIGSQSSR